MIWLYNGTLTPTLRHTTQAGAGCFRMAEFFSTTKFRRQQSAPPVVLAFARHWLRVKQPTALRQTMVDANAVPHCVIRILVSSATQRLAADPVSMLRDT